MKYSWDKHKWMVAVEDGLLLGEGSQVMTKLKGPRILFDCCIKIRAITSREPKALQDLYESIVVDVPMVVARDIINRLVEVELLVEHKQDTQARLILKRLQQSKLVVIGARTSVEYLSNSLNKIQPAKLQSLVCDELGQTTLFTKLMEVIFDPDYLVIALANNVIQRLQWFPLINKVCLDQSCSVIYAYIDDVLINMGPLSIPGETACYRCLALREENHLPNLAVYQEFISQVNQIKSDVIHKQNPHAQRIMCELMHNEIVNMLTRRRLPRVYDYVCSINVDSLEAVKHAVLRVPLCDQCGVHVKKPFMKLWSI